MTCVKPRRGGGSGREARRQRLRVEQPPVVEPPAVDDAHDVRMLEPSEDAPLSLEAAPPLVRHGRVRAANDFDGDALFEGAVDAHPVAIELGRGARR